MSLRTVVDKNIVNTLAQAAHAAVQLHEKRWRGRIRVVTFEIVKMTPTPSSTIIHASLTKKPIKARSMHTSSSVKLPPSIPKHLTPLRSLPSKHSYPACHTRPSSPMR